MTITEYLETKTRTLLISLGTLLLVLVALGDYLLQSTYVLEFPPFYLVPISFFSWFIGRRAGVAVAIVSLCIDFLIRLRHIPGAIGYLDTFLWLVLYIGSTFMISQLKKLYEREQHLSRIDPLTMVSNRRGFFEHATQAKSFSNRHNATLSIAYIDLDNFKQINDRLGHITGDNLLAIVADGIRKALRPTDVVARIGGDEFAVLLPETDEEMASRIVSRVRVELEKAMQERNWAMTFSIGLTSFSPPIDSVQQMIQAADQAMYAAKGKGKNQVEQRYLAG